MRVHYARHLREKVWLSVPPSYKPLERRQRTIRISREAFEEIGDYTRSVPTSPSVGRIYRKNLGWRPNQEDNWFVYIVIKDPDYDGMLHVPYSPEFTS